MVDFYHPGASWLHRADPRVKLAFAVVSVAALLAVRELPIMLAALAVLAALYLSAGIPAGRVWRIVMTVGPVGLLMAGLRALFYPSGTELWALGPVQITAGGLEDGAVLGLRLIAMALAIFLWLFTTSSQAIVRSFTELGLPFDWGLSLGLALRFVPTVQSNWQTIEQAQRARGFVPEELGMLARARALVPGLVALIVASFRDSENVARALDSRAFGAAGVQRTSLEPVQFRAVDALYLALILIGAAVLVGVSLE